MQEDDPQLDELVASLEALLFTCSEPVPEAPLAEALCEGDLGALHGALEALGRQLAEPYRGLELAEVAGGWRLQTRPRFAEVLKAFHRRVQKVRLTMASLETLSIIGYLQPVSTPEIEMIRGVSAQQTIHGLLEKGLVRIVGRKEAPGRPMLYGTTAAFLEHFALPSLDALPRSMELEKWKREFRSGSPEPVSVPAEPVSPSSERDESVSEITPSS